jgi:site-specific recombinase XerC
MRTLIDALPADTIWRRRDRAVVAFALLSGARVSAIRSRRLKHIDIENRTVFQDAKVVDTKNSKTMLTSWFPVGSDIEQIVIDWIDEIRRFGAVDDDPLFPRAPNRIRDARKPREFAFWSGTQQIRDIFADGTKRAGIDDFHPHAIRRTLTKFMFKVVASAEEMKAWSQSLGHDDLGTTIEHYGTLENEHVQRLMNEVRERLENPSTKEIIDLPYASSTNLKVIRLLLTDSKGTSG